MDVATLKTQIQQHDLKNFYIFTGEEWYMQNLYMRQIAKSANLNLNSVDDVHELFTKLGKRSMFQSNAVYILRDDQEIIKNSDIIEKLKKIINKNIVILTLSSVDKRTKIYKTYKDTFIEFKTLERAVLKRHVMNNIALTSKHADMLIDICDSNYGRILLEIDKIKALSGDVNESFKKLIKEGVIFQSAYDAIFDFVDYVLMHDIEGTYDALDNCKRIGEATLVMLSVLYTNTKQVLQVQSYDGDNIEKATGLTAVQIKHAKRRCGVYRTGDLVYMLKLIQRLEVEIKSGLIDESIAVDYLLVNIL